MILEATALESEFVPEIVMVNMQGFALSEKSEYLIKTMEYFDEAEINLALALKHAEKYPHLVKLKAGADDALVINDIIDHGNEARVRNFKAQMLNDKEFFQSALSELSINGNILSGIKSVTK